MVNPYVWIAGVTLILCTHGAAYWKGHESGAEGERAKQQVELDKWRQNADAAAELYEEEKAKKAPMIRTIYKTKEVIREKNPDFANCHTGADGLRALSDRIELTNSGLAAPGVSSAGQAQGR